MMGKGGEIRRFRRFRTDDGEGRGDPQISQISQMGRQVRGGWTGLDLAPRSMSSTGPIPSGSARHLRTTLLRVARTQWRLWRGGRRLRRTPGTVIGKLVAEARGRTHSEGHTWVGGKESRAGTNGLKCRPDPFPAFYRTGAVSGDGLEWIH